MKTTERLDRYLDDLNADRASKPAIPHAEAAALYRMARRLKVAAQRAPAAPDADFADTLERELLACQAFRHATPPTSLWRKALTPRPLVGSLSLWERARVRVSILSQGVREAAKGRGAMGWQTAPLWQRGAAIALVLLLAVGLTVTALGPQRVLADLQRMLGYVSGVGFINLEQTRLLSAPIEAQRDGVTLRVDQVLAGPDRTVVMLHSEGLPPAEHESAGGRAHKFEARLRLPDGQTLTPHTWRLNWGAGTLELPALPEGIYHVTLEIARLPLVPEGVAPENWEVPLALQPATGPLVAALFPEPYAPPQAEDTHHDITLRVVEVAHGPEETAISLQVQWPEEKGQWPMLTGQFMPALRDDLGHIYWEGAPAANRAASMSAQAKESTPGGVLVAESEIMRISPNSEPTATPLPAGIALDEKLLTFAPLSLAARQLTLSVDSVWLDVPTAARFSVDLGSDPHIGDTWPLDVHLDVAGFPVRIATARLVTETVQWRDGSSERRLLEFDIARVPEKEGRILSTLALATSDPRFDGTTGGHSRDAGIHVALTLAENASLPSGVIQVEVERASIYFRGPWEMTWDVPTTDKGNQAVAPVVSHPQEVSQTREGLTLTVEEAVLTDRVTIVTVDLQNPPDGIQLTRFLWGTGTPGEGRIWLEDDRGASYRHRGFGVNWRAPEEVDTPFDEALLPLDRQRLPLEPVNPLARWVTLHIPAIETLRPADLNLQVEVPADLTLPAGFSSAFADHAASNGPTWDVDIPIEVGGYTWRFETASLQSINGRIRLVLGPALDQTAQRRPWPTGFCIASVTGPDGQAVAPGIGAWGMGQPCERTIAFAVDDPDTGQLQPGIYHIELAGIAVGVPGPWDLRWELRGH